MSETGRPMADHKLHCTVRPKLKANFSGSGSDNFSGSESSLIDRRNCQTVKLNMIPSTVVIFLQISNTPVESECMTVSIIKGDAGDDDGLDLPGLAVRLVQLVGHQLHLPRHGEHALRHRTRPQTLVQLLLDTAEQRVIRVDEIWPNWMRSKLSSVDEI